MSEEFKREFRILTAKQFDVVFRRGQKAFAKPFTIIFHQNQLTYARIGFAISKKRVRLASQRNRLKRIIRECFRRLHGNLSNHDVVVIANLQGTVLNADLSRAACKLLKRLCVNSVSASLPFTKDS